jgi:hypothetical protein
MKGRGVVIAALVGLWLAVALNGGHAGGQSPAGHALFVPVLSGRWTATKLSALNNLSAAAVRSARARQAPHPSRATPGPGQTVRSAQRSAAPAQPAWTIGNWLLVLGCAMSIAIGAVASAMTAIGIRAAR